jgi:hypothetical protein
MNKFNTYIDLISRARDLSRGAPVRLDLGWGNEVTGVTVGMCLDPDRVRVLWDDTLDITHCIINRLEFLSQESPR